MQLALVAAPALSVVVPSGQRVHAGEPGAGANVPTSHLPHAAAEVLPVKGLEVPAAQGRQALREALPTLGLYAPAGQLVQPDVLFTQLFSCAEASAKSALDRCEFQM
jgi:hypothetical protein